MTNARRLDVYLRNGRPLTARQARRWRHNRGRPDRTPVSLRNEGVDILSPVLAAADPRWRRRAWLTYRGDARMEASQ